MQRERCRLLLYANRKYWSNAGKAPALEVPGFWFQYLVRRAGFEPAEKTEDDIS
jgi:hypothetical protein